MDTFSGNLTLTAVEMSAVRSAVIEAYVKGGWVPDGVSRRDFYRGILIKFGQLKLKEGDK